jgi:hypothetical protein
LGICTATAHPNVHCRPQLLLASLPDLESIFAHVGLDCARGFPVRITPPVVMLVPQLRQPEWLFLLETQNWFAATPSSSHASGMQAYASSLRAIVNSPVIYSRSLHSVAKLLVLHRMIEFANRLAQPAARHRLKLAVRGVLILVVVGNSVGIVSNAVCSAFSVQLVSLYRDKSDAQTRGDAHPSSFISPSPSPAAVEADCLTHPPPQMIHQLIQYLAKLLKSAKELT